MGQRHQAFIIARILTAQGETHYRCVGALHHQWCYGTLPLFAASRFLILIKQKDNAEIVREELRLIQGRYGKCKELPKIPRVPLPYTTFLLASSWSTDYEDPLNPYASGISFRNSVLPAGMGSTEGDNNDGITVIDITIPENPSYCFISGSDLSNANDRVPISAEEYVRSYYSVPDDEEEEHLDEECVMKSIASLEGVPLASLEMLADAWPHEYQKASENPQTGAPDASEETANTAIPALTDLALQPAVEHALRTDQTTEIEELLWMPRKMELIKEILQAENPFPASGIALLTKIITLEAEADKIIDLSHFFLSSEQIVSVVAKFQAIEVLRLSHNTNVTIDTVRAVLTSLPHLRRLFLLDTSVANKDLCDLLSNEPKLFHNMETLIHPCFLLSEEGAYPNAFSLIVTPAQNHSLAAASLPYFTPAMVVQALTDYLIGFSSEDSYPYPILQSTLVPQVMLAASIRQNGQGWTERSVPLFAQFSLRAFTGEGWFFAFQWPLFSYNNTPDKKYAFVKANPAAFKKTIQVKEPEQSKTTDDENAQAAQHVVCDLGGFLKEMEREGRPAPAAPAVDELVAIFKKLCDGFNLKLMSHDEVNPFVGAAISRQQFRY